MDAIEYQAQRALLPSETYDRFFIRARHADYEQLMKKRNEQTCGKWMVFPHVSDIDNVWMVVRDATEQGQLGYAAKVATMKPNRNAVKQDEKVVCIYTLDSDDKSDVIRVLSKMRELGINYRAMYKEDSATHAKIYARSGKRVSKYWAKYGEVELL